MGRTADYSRQSCCIAATLEIIGDPWTLLVVREAFRGVRRFEQWQEKLGVARNVLAARLKTLVQHGILEPKVYSERPLRQEYLLTAKGKELNAVLLTLFDWGARNLYQDEAAAVSFRHVPCGHTLKPQLVCSDCGEPIKPRDLEMVMTSGPTVGEVLAKDDLVKDEAAA
jgi:DNA-binding HxlR family transcriptional regulator